MQKNRQKKFFFFLITASKIDCINIVPIKKRILVIGSQCVNRHS